MRATLEQANALPVCIPPARRLRQGAKCMKGTAGAVPSGSKKAKSLASVQKRLCAEAALENDRFKAHHASKGDDFLQGDDLGGAKNA